MRGAATRSLAVGVKVPFDYTAAQSMADWRESLAWPVPPPTLRRIFQRGVEDLLAFVEGLTDKDQQNIALLAAPLILHTAWPLVETALCAQAEVEGRFTFVGGPPELDYLRGGSSAFLPPARVHSKTLLIIPRLRVLREIAATSLWTQSWRLPAAMLAPEVVAIARHPLLADFAAAQKRRIRFAHGPMILQKARAAQSPTNRSLDLDLLAQRLTELIAHVEELREPYARRLRHLIKAQCVVILRIAAEDLAGLAQIKRLPHELWSGSGGFYPSRAIGLEVLRRGGEVTRFDHGGTTGMVAVDGTFALLQLSVGSRFVMMTPGTARIAKATRAPFLASRLRRCEIVGSAGDPSIRALPLTTRRAPAGRRKVIYAPMLLRGFAKAILTIFPDVMYLDWQLRLAEMLASLPIHLLCKPHPGGILRGRRHPLASVAATTYEPFEAVMQEADVFVFDRCTSTTFWRALCTDRPVVYIDLGIPFSAQAKPLIERRCRVLTATFGADNRPIIDRVALEEAVMRAADRVDPSEFQRLFMGEARS